jgi:hypothetical protein
MTEKGSDVDAMPEMTGVTTTELVAFMIGCVVPQRMRAPLAS